MAPGSSITTGVPGGFYGTGNGTSLATPHVAGAIALLKDVRQRATVNQVLQALRQGGVPVSRAGVTKRRIDLIRAKLRLLSLL
jgi:subtilisin family serine protease